MKKTYLVGATFLFLVLVGGGCGSSAKAPNNSTAAPLGPAASDQDAGQSSFISTVASKLAAANLNYSQSDMAPKLGAMGIAANVKSATKFKVGGGAANIEVIVFDLNSAADNAAVKAALENNFAAVKQASIKYQTKIVAVGGDITVVGLVYHSDDRVKGAAVEAALVK